MLPEEHRDTAKLGTGNMTDAERAIHHVMLGILEALLQMEICGHGTRGFCKDCFGLELSNRIPYPYPNK